MSDYEHDFYTWTQEQARALREGRFTELDLEHLAEEIEDMGKSEARGLQAQIERLIAAQVGLSAGSQGLARE